MPVEDKEAEEDAGGSFGGDMFLNAVVLAIGAAIYASFNLDPIDERVGVIISAIVIISIVIYHSAYFRKNDEQ